MHDPIVVIGTGEMSGVFTRGFLKQGYPVFPVTRQMDMAAIAKAITVPALVLVATGSEVNLALEVKAALGSAGDSVRVVSMPSRELFLKAPEKYRKKLIPDSASRVLLESGVSLGWSDVVGPHAGMVTIDRFGESAPAARIAERFGFTAAAVKEKHLKYGAVDIPVDTVGLGAGVHDILKSWGLPVREFKASHRPRDRERFKMFRDEAFWGLRERFRDGLIDLSQVSQRAFDRLLGQLHKMKFYADAMGRTCIEGKDEYRKRQSKMVGEDNARSPDYADSLCIANSRGVGMVFDYTGADFSAVRKSA